MASVFLEIDFTRIAWRTAGHVVLAPAAIDAARWPELFAEAFEAGPTAHGTIDNRHGYAAARHGDHEVVVLTSAPAIPTEWIDHLIGFIADLGGDLPQLQLAQTRIQLEGVPDPTPQRHIGRVS